MTKQDKNKQQEEWVYDPVKEIVGNKAAEKVIWSTKSLQMAVDGLKKGMPLKANPFCGKNTKLLKPNLVYKRTKEEIDDYIRCMQDPIYFASLCHLMTPNGLKPCVLRDYQVEYLKHLKDHRFSIFLSCRQSGKSTTTAIYCLWNILFNTDKSGLILSKSGPAGQDLLSKIKDMFLFLPYHLKCGVMKWNQSSISFDNNSKIETEAFSPTAGLGKTINFLILDEFAWCPPNEVELFSNNIIPTISADTSANICIMSTENGFNLFYKLYTAAVKEENIYAPFKVDWWQVPMWDKTLKAWIKRDETWKKTMIGVLGSEEAFFYQYGTQFSISDACLVSRETMARIHIKERLFRNLLDNDNLLDNAMIDAGITLSIQHKDKLFFDSEFDFAELKTKHFLVLADLAEGGGGDYTVFHIFRIDSKEEFTQIGFWTANKVDLEHAALDYWLMCCQLFNAGRSILSLEWNTYGALFYQYLKNYNEPDYDEETLWRFRFANIDEGLDLYNFALYKKDSIESEAIGKHTSNYIPGIRFSGANKHVACSLLRMLLEKDKVKIFDIGTINELENFEDKNGNGSYKAKTGHDDLIMTLCQIPMVQQTSIYKEFMEDFEAVNIKNNIDSKWSNNINSDSLYGPNTDNDDDLSLYGINNHSNIFNPMK